MYDLIRENKRNEKETRYACFFYFCDKYIPYVYAKLSPSKTVFHDVKQKKVFFEAAVNNGQNHLPLKNLQFLTVGQSQLTWKQSHGVLLPAPLSNQECLTPGCLKLRLVHREGSL